MKSKFFSVILIIAIISISVAAQPVVAADSSQVLELLLDEGTGTVAADSSGNSNDALIRGATWAQLDTGKWVLQFNGAGSNIKVPTSTSININGTEAQLSLETWVNFGSGNGMRLLGNGSGGSTGGYAIYYTGSRTLGYIEGNSDNSGWFAAVSSGQKLVMDVWYHVVYTYDGQNGRIYVDGVPVGVSADWTGGIFSTTSPFYVYSDFLGQVGKIGVYNQALSADAVSALYNSGKNDYYAALQDAEIYVYPAITDAKITPTTAIDAKYLTGVLTLDGSPGEFRPATFVVKAPYDITGLTVSVSDLTGSAGLISRDALDIKSVACWFQSGTGVSDVHGLVMTPELLLKDDSLIKVEDGQNYLKLTDGSYRWISDPTPAADRQSIISLDDFPVQDAAGLQPVDIQADMNKQFWVTLGIPTDAAAGTYNGSIVLSTTQDVVGELQVDLTVHPIALDDPYLEYSGYYFGTLHSQWPDGSISSYFKSEDQLTAEMTDLVAHGLNNPIVFQGYSEVPFSKVLTLRDSLGMSDKPLYYAGLDPWGYQSVSDVEYILSFVEKYGIDEVYFYGEDEAQGDALTAQRDSWQAIQAAGGKIFASGYPSDQSDPGEFAAVGDVLDLFVSSGSLSAAEAALWHAEGHRIFSYGNPQMGEENPAKYRLNYGLLLWQNDYDGAMDFAYQYGFGNVWNDFDDTEYRDHNMTYPTIDGVIDTIQWEGFREGVNDIRYLTTLLETIKESEAAGKDTSAAEAWLADLKASTFSAGDLDSIRAEMVDQIVALQNAEGQVEPQLSSIVITTAGSVIENSAINDSIVPVEIAAGSTLAFSAQGYDAGGNPIDGLQYDWTVSDPVVGTIDELGTFTAGDTSGSFFDAILVTSGDITASVSIVVLDLYPAWDVNQDGVVNVLDLILVGQHMRETGEPGWIPEDVNSDGVVNQQDQKLIKENITK